MIYTNRNFSLVISINFIKDTRDSLNDLDNRNENRQAEILQYLQSIVEIIAKI